ncbi:glycine oxidase ThiO [Saccharothrix violaceirubra]|uniref:glycine oxidase n=1 Tax=Saccharothrix violaceirubra TaxID=413306 RepID=A0A7W7TBK8_9PSEU|nr:glycine oxidase ThiO [Saccharothrix violaceirubra]MBB4968805.1 glycine oxidase [Saccharothrix violaceirubra]
MTTDVTVLGGGVIGLSVAWTLARADYAVAVVDRGSRHGGSHVAGGMLAPITEAWPGDEDVLDLGVESLGLWPAFAADLGVPLSPVGTLAVGVDGADTAVLDQLCGYLAARGRAADRLTGRGLRALEPGLGTSVRSGLSVPGDLSVDNRVLLAALRAACAGHGVRFVDGADSPVTVIAAGAWSRDLHPALRTVIRPVKGEILRLSTRPGALPPPRHTIRAHVEGRQVYLVPRADGIVLGATQYEAGFDADVTVGGVRDLLRDGEVVWPGIAGYALAETAVGFRAGSPDNAPVVRWLEPGVLAATGHHRNGLLLAPVTARRVLELVGEGGRR